jgi:hypothetical protein
MDLCVFLRMYFPLNNIEKRDINDFAFKCADEELGVVFGVQASIQHFNLSYMIAINNLLPIS